MTNTNTSRSCSGNSGISKESNLILKVNIAGLLSALLYLGLGICNDVLMSLSAGTFILFMALLSSVSFLLFRSLHQTDKRLKVGDDGLFNYVWPIIAWAVLFRLIGIFFSPIFEDDFYRYLWDGFQFFDTGSPYGKAPSSFFGDTSIPRSMQPILDGINYPDIATIYGPVFQYSFLLAHKLLPANVFALQALYSLIDVALILVLSRLCRPKMLLLYAWCPLAVKEIAFTAHPDGLAIFLLMTAFLALSRDKALIAAVFLALSVCAKIFALLFVPFLLIRVAVRYWFVFTFLIALIYTPFLLSNSADIAVLFVFASNWQFNGSLHPLILSGFGYWLPQHSAAATSMVCAVIFLGFYAAYGWRFFRDKQALIPRGDWILGVFFLVAPVLNAWYLLWLLAFATIYPSRWAWLMSVSIVFSYVTGYTTGQENLELYEQPLWARIIEYGAVLIAIYFDIKAKRNKNLQNSTENGVLNN